MICSVVGAGTALSIFSIPVQSLTYSSSVFPILLTVAAMAPIEKFFAKHSPEMIRSIIEPLCTYTVTYYTVTDNGVVYDATQVKNDDGTYSYTYTVDGVDKNAENAENDAAGVETKVHT